MTWVIGSPTTFGYSIGLADIQATIQFKNGTKKYLDCVQKIFPVGKFIVAGFCGSIQTGFFLIEDLKKWLYLPDKNQAWIPNLVVQKWYKRAKWLFSKIESKQKTQLLIIGIHPKQDNGIEGQPKTYGYILKSPDFIPEEIEWGKVKSIGSGNNVNTYLNAIEEINNNVYNPLMQLETNSPGGYGKALAIHLSTEVEHKPIKGISKHFHICIVRRGIIELGNNNHTIYPNDNDNYEVKMPKISSTWKEFKQMVKENNINIANAKAYV